MNQPDRYSRFILPEGVSKLEFKRDEKLQHAGTITLQNEDHTVGNLVRMQLHDDETVVFAGYRVPHPLESRMLIMVQTTGQKSPIQAVEHALDDLRSEFGTIASAFDEEVRRLCGFDYMQTY